MYKTYVWEYSKDEMPILYTLLDIDKVNKLYHIAKLAVFCILSNHFQNIPQERLLFIIEQATDKCLSKNIEYDNICSITTEQMDEYLNVFLKNIMKYSYEILMNSIKKLRIYSNSYIYIKNH